MANQKWKLGVAGFVATALITATSLTGASVDAASNTEKDLNKQLYTSNWQTVLVNNLFQKLADQTGYVTIGNMKFNLNSGFCAPTTAPTVTPAPTKTPSATEKPTATPSPTVKPTTPPPSPTVKPTTPPSATVTPTATPAPTSTPVTDEGNTPSATATQQEILNLVNAQRSAAGLKALTLDTALNKVAMEKARDMDVNNYFSHNSPTYGSPFDMMKSFGISYSYAGENIATGQTSAAQVMNDWMNSSGHRANILNANFTKLGVGYVNGKWVQEFIG